MSLNIFPINYCISLSVTREVLCALFYLCILFIDYIFSLYIKGSIPLVVILYNLLHMLLNSACGISGIGFSCFCILKLIHPFVHEFSFVDCKVILYFNIAMFVLFFPILSFLLHLTLIHIDLILLHHYIVMLLYCLE